MSDRAGALSAVRCDRHFEIRWGMSCSGVITAAQTAGIVHHIYSQPTEDIGRRVRGFWCLAGCGVFVLALLSRGFNRCQQCHSQQSPERPVQCT